MKRPRQLKLGQQPVDVVLTPPVKVVIHTTTKTKKGYVMQNGLAGNSLKRDHLSQ